MNRTEKYLQQILLLLLEQEGYVTLQELSDSLKLSKRSIQNYLSRAGAWLLEHHLEQIRIVKKPGTGIRLAADAKERQRLNEMVNSRNFTMLDESADRRQEILRSLLFSKDALTIQFFADYFYVSRSMILFDLEWVEDWLEAYRLTLFKTRHRGLEIKGDEADRRAAIASFFDLRPEAFREQGTAKNLRITAEGMKKLREVYSLKEIEAVCKAVDEAEKEFDFFLDRASFTVLVMHIIIGISRVRHGCLLNQDAKEAFGKPFLTEQNAADMIADSLEESFSIPISQAERNAIGTHLMSFNAITECLEKGDFFSEKIEMLAYDLMERLSALTGSPFLYDKMLYFGLVFHLKNSVYRLQNEPWRGENDFLDWIGEEQEIYSCIWEARELYQSYTGVTPDARECVCITLHFLDSQKRMKTSKRVLLVANVDILKRRELKERLENMLPGLCIVEQCTTLQLPLCREEAYDLIITMNPLEEGNKPVADLSHIEQTEWKTHLEKFFEKKSFSC